MGNYKSRRPGMLQGWQMAVAEMVFHGKSNDEIIDALFENPYAPLSENQRRNYKSKIQRLFKNEMFKNYYQSIITEWSVHNVGPALMKLSEQVNSAEPWLANKAANDVLTRGMKAFEDEDANKIRVEIVGMPELGSPDKADD